MLFASVLTGTLAAAMPLSAEIPFSQGLAIGIRGAGRTLLRNDPIENQLIRGAFRDPAEGDKVGESAWTAVKAGSDGRFTGDEFRSGYGFFVVQSPKEALMVLEAGGASMVYVNGEARVADVYGHGHTAVPVKLKAGENRFLFALSRGFLNAKLTPKPAQFSLDARDATTPDIIEGERGRAWAAIHVRNGSDQWAGGLSIEAKAIGGGRPVRTKVGAVMPMSYRKAGFQLDLASPKGAYEVRLLDKGKVVHTTSLTLRRQAPGRPYKRTFLSRMDGSVQYYAVNPSSTPGAGQALFLSLHGASVEAIGQAESYGQKAWGHLVAPTNRRPFGFNWEDIGRRDALEVLEAARESLKTDPSRTFVKGHSMGGHGTWHMAATFPSLFAAAAPAAGWIDFWSYGGGPQFDLSDPLQASLNRVSTVSRTTLFEHNLRQIPIFVLHGDADQTVPVSEPRRMRDLLASTHSDFHYHEEPGGSHWYDNDPEPGASCQDFLPIFDLFSRRRIPALEEVRRVDFSTASPRVSARHFWLTIEQQDEPFSLTRVFGQRDPGARAFSLTTSNARRLSLSTKGMFAGGPVTLVLDGQQLSTPFPKEGGEIHVDKRAGGQWSISSALSPDDWAMRNPPAFKDSYDNRILFVVGTGGTPAENDWAMRKARYDAEWLAYQGNASVDIVLDKAFLAEQHKGRNLLLYGHSQMNSAWDKVLGNAEAKALRGAVARGRMRDQGSFAVLVAAPRSDDPERVAAAIAGTDSLSMESLIRVLPYAPAQSAGNVFVRQLNP